MPKACSRKPVSKLPDSAHDSLPAWRREPERGGAFAIRLMCWLAVRMPEWFARPVVTAAALYFSVFPSQTSRNGSTVYLRKVLGRESFTHRFRQVHHFANVAYERVLLLAHGADRFQISPADHPVIEDRVVAGHGAVLLGAHLGSFEALRAFDRTLPGMSVRYLMFQENAQALTSVLQRLNPAIAEQVISVSDGQNAMLAVREALDEGRFVAFLGDRETDPNPRAQVSVDFFGQPISVPRAPYLCAIMAGAPLITAFAVYKGPRNYEAVFTELYDGRPVPRSDRDAVCHAMAQAYADQLEEMCRRFPYNWFNFFDIWSESGG